MPSSIKNVLLTGATGFTGSFVAKEFLKALDTYSLHIFARSKEKVESFGYNTLPVTIHYGSFEEEESFEKACEGIDVVVNTASLGFGHARLLIETFQKTGIKRAVFISTTAIFTNLNSKSKKIRLEAEELIKNSMLKYTIIRPTMIFGTKDDRNICRLIRYLNRWPVIPGAGPGTYLLQPVYVLDLAKAIVSIVKNKNTIKKIYNLSGKDAVSYNQLVSIISGILNKKIIVIHFPLPVLTFFFSMYEKIVRNPKIKVEQLLRLNENKNFSYSDSERDFGYNPTPIEQALKQEVQEITTHS